MPHFGTFKTGVDTFLSKLILKEHSQPSDWVTCISGTPYCFTVPPILSMAKILSWLPANTLPYPNSCPLSLKNKEPSVYDCATPAFTNVGVAPVIPVISYKPKSAEVVPVGWYQQYGLLFVGSKEISPHITASEVATNKGIVTAFVLTSVGVAVVKSIVYKEIGLVLESIYILPVLSTPALLKVVAAGIPVTTNGVVV